MQIELGLLYRSKTLSGHISRYLVNNLHAYHTIIIKIVKRPSIAYADIYEGHLESNAHSSI